MNQPELISCTFARVITLRDRTLRHRRIWHAGWNLRRRSIRLQITAVHARTDWSRVRKTGPFTRLYQHVE